MTRRGAASEALAGGHLAVLLLLASGCTAALVPRTVVDDPSVPSVELGGVKLHVHTAGDPENRTVIVLHGGPGFDFRALLPLEALADRYFVVFYDQRGSGLSERVKDDRLRLADFYEELDAVVDHFGHGRPVSIVGHSWGAMLASGYVGRHPEKVDHLVLAEPGMLNAETGRILMAATNHMRPRFGLDLIYEGARVWLQSLQVDGPDGDARHDYLVNGLMTAHISGHPMAGYFCNRDLSNGKLESWRFGARANAALLHEGFDEAGDPRIDFVDGLDRFRHKVLFIAGSCNTVIGEAQQRLHMRYFPDAELVIIQGAGHTMFGEKPAESVDAVRRYLDAPN
jgi:proline iminopeptidase